MSTTKEQQHNKKVGLKLILASIIVCYIGFPITYLTNASFVCWLIIGILSLALCYYGVLLRLPDEGMSCQ
jgi:undecaprenyl pyrophosphate phosphatase UppP